MRVGFPHSDIPGSKPVCRLPEAYRRLLRPSSPVIAKASTTCTCSLDPITLNPRACARSPRPQVNSCLPHSTLLCVERAIQSNPVPDSLRTREPHFSMMARGPHRTETFTSSNLLKSATANEFFYRRIHKQARGLPMDSGVDFAAWILSHASVGSGSLPS